jgi:hypothetical protein
MPMSPGASRLLHYSGYFHPIMSLLIGAAFLIAIPFWLTSGQPVDLENIAVLGALGVAGLGYGAFALRRQLKQDPTMPIQTVDDLPPAEGARQTRRGIWVIAIIAVLGTAFMAYQLVQVEFGTERNVTVWAPVAMMYQFFGFWPAVLFVPALGLFIIAVMARKLRTIKEAQTGRL